MPKVKKEIAKKPKAVKKVSTKKVVEKKEKKAEPKEKFIEAIGRRKTALARVRIFPQGGKEFLINDKPLEKYFPMVLFQEIVLSPLEKMGFKDKFKITVITRGGGLHAQAVAIRHGVARALVLFNPDFRIKLKQTGYLTRDPRARERKKPGLKRARKAPQWKKR